MAGYLRLKIVPLRRIMVTITKLVMKGERDESQNRPIPRETRDGLYFQAERDNVYASYMRFMIRDRGRKFNQE